jgi:hypothetical protein
MDTKLCSTCKEVKPISDFGVNRGKPRHQCKECKNKDSKEWYSKNKERKKELSSNYRHTKKNQDLKKAYGITLDDYNNMLVEQNNQCKICMTSADRLKRSLCVDHDHSTGKVRGLLCDTCNRSLGLLKDNIDILKKAVQYLQEAEQT